MTGAWSPRVARLRDPGDIQALHALTQTHLARRAGRTALRLARQLLTLHPNRPRPQWCLGRALLFDNQPDLARLWLKQALAALPHDPEITLDLSACLTDLGRPAEAFRVVAESLAIHTGHPALRQNFGILALMLGHLDAGWWGLATASVASRLDPRAASLPRWHPGRPAGERVLVWGHQGLGDDILYGTCLPDLLDRPVEVVLAADERLAPLMTRSLPGLIPGSWRHPGLIQGCASQMPLIDLPRYFRPTTAHFAGRGAYLQPDPARREKWRTWLAAQGPGPWIGLAWTTRMAGDRRDLYSPPLAAWTRLLSAAPGRFIVLQYGDSTDDLAALRAGGAPPPILPPLDLTNDQDELAALMAALDLVISPGIAVADLAGALGVPCWVPMPWISPHWRSLGTGGWPWYPSWRLFRRRANQNWMGVIEDMIAALRNPDGPPDPDAPAPSAARIKVPPACPAEVLAPLPPRAARLYDPGNHQILHRLVQAHLHQRDGAAALPLARQLLILDPTRPVAHRCLGRALLFDGQAALAVPWLERALAAQPDHPGTCLDLSVALMALGQAEPALQAVARTLATQKRDPGLLRNFAVIALTLGHLEAGWGALSATLPPHPDRRIGALPPWTPDRPAGEKVLVWSPHDLGDNFLYGTCLTDLLDQGVRVVLACDPRLNRLMARSLPGLMIAADNDDHPAQGCSSQITMGALPRFFRARHAGFAGSGAYLRPDPEARNRWRQWLAGLGPGRLVGLVWTTGRGEDHRDLASPPLDQWSRLMAEAPVRFIVLQYGDQSGGAHPDLAELTPAGVPKPIAPPLDVKDDQDELAALMSALDLVISPANAVADLAGALGVPCWVPMPWHAPHWKSLGTGGWPWYRSWRLFRRRPGQTWAAVIEDLIAAVSAPEIQPPAPWTKPGPSAPPRPAALTAPLTPRAARVFEPMAPQATRELARAHLARGDALTALPLAHQQYLMAPEQAQTRRLLGRALMFASQPAKASRWLKAALDQRPFDPDITIDLSVCLADLGHPAAAHRLVGASLARHPGHLQLMRNFGLLALILGRLAPGWDALTRASMPPRLDARIAHLPAWHPDRPAGDQVLVWRHQGLGDDIIYGTCLPDLLARPVKVVLACEHRLVPLMARSLPGATVHAWRDPDVARGCTSQIPLAALPRFFRRSLAAFAGRGAYLQPDADARDRWRTWLADTLGSGPHMGLAWTTRRSGDRRDLYTPPLDQWARLAAAAPGRFVVLQYGDNTADLAALGLAGVPAPLVPPLDLTNDQDCLAALIAALDLVISPGIAVADLAGALGTPCWVPMPWHAPHWQSLGTGGWPWYPSWRLFRKPIGRSWGEVVDDMVAALHIWRRDHQS